MTTLCLRSVDRDSGSIDAYSTTLIDALHGTCELVGASLRQSAFTISRRNSDVRFRLGPTTYVASIAAGFYTPMTLAIALQTAMNAIVGGPASFTVAYNITSGRLEVTNLTALLFQIRMGAPALANSAGAVVGMTQGIIGASPLAGNAPHSLDPPEYFVVLNETGGLHNAKTGHTFTFRISNSNTDGTYNLATFDLDHGRNIPRQRVTIATPTKQLTVRVVDGDSNAVPLQSEWSLYLRKVCD